MRAVKTTAVEQIILTMIPGLRRQRLPRLPWRPPRHAVPQARGGRQGRHFAIICYKSNLCKKSKDFFQRIEEPNG
jgi:hypothetical protein